MTRASWWGAARAASICAAVATAAGCGGPSPLEGPDDPLTAVVVGRVYAQDGRPVPGAAVEVEAWRDAGAQPLAAHVAARADAEGGYAATLRVPGFAPFSASAVVRARSPGGNAATGETRGAPLYFVPRPPADIAPVGVDVTLGTSVLVP